MTGKLSLRFNPRALISVPAEASNQDGPSTETGAESERSKTFRRTSPIHPLAHTTTCWKLIESAKLGDHTATASKRRQRRRRLLDRPGDRITIEPTWSNFTCA